PSSGCEHTENCTCAGTGPLSSTPLTASADATVASVYMWGFFILQVSFAPSRGALRRGDPALPHDLGDLIGERDLARLSQHVFERHPSRAGNRARAVLPVPRIAVAGDQQ